MKDAACAEALQDRQTPSPRPPKKESQASKDQLGRGAVGRRGAKEYIQTKTREAALRHVNDTRHLAASLRFSRDSARGRLGGGRRKWDELISDRRWPITGSAGRFLRRTNGLSDNNPAISRQAGAPATFR